MKQIINAGSANTKRIAANTVVNLQVTLSTNPITVMNSHTNRTVQSISNNATSSCESVSGTQPEVKFDYDDSEVDHQWFELQKEGFEETAEKATVSVSADDLVAAFHKCKNNWVDIYFGAAEKPALDEMIQSAHIMDLYFKPYTCCRWAHQPIKACIDLLHDNGIAPREIARATIHTFRSAALLSKKVPESTDEAQYNIAFPVASALLYGDVSFDQVCEAALANYDVLDMMQRLEFVVDPEMEKEFPARRLAWVELTLKDGTVYTSDVYDAPGEPEDPNLSVGWIADKFKRITRSMLEADRQEQLLGIMTTQFDTPVRDVVGQINDSLKSKRGNV